MAKVKSPTGRPSKVNPDVEKAMRGEGGSRKSAYSKSSKSKSKDSKRGEYENIFRATRRKREEEAGLRRRYNGQTTDSNNY